MGWGESGRGDLIPPQREAHFTMIGPYGPLSQLTAPFHGCHTETRPKRWMGFPHRVTVSHKLILQLSYGYAVTDPDRQKNGSRPPWDHHTWFDPQSSPSHNYMFFSHYYLLFHMHTTKTFQVLPPSPLPHGSYIKFYIVSSNLIQILTRILNTCFTNTFIYIYTVSWLSWIYPCNHIRISYSNINLCINSMSHHQ